MKTHTETDQKRTSPRNWVQRLVRRLSFWAWREELKLHQNVVEDAQALVDALMRGERADAYCGYGRDGQASNYRDELKWSLRSLPNVSGQTCGACAIAFMGSLNRIVCSRWFGSVV